MAEMFLHGAILSFPWIVQSLKESNKTQKERSLMSKSS